MDDKILLFQYLAGEIDRILAGNAAAAAKLEAVCRLLSTEVDYYHWVGFYVVNGNRKELVLGPFIGASTEHVVIPFGRGICGQAASRERTIIVQDVARETNYLSCAPDVKSEIVVPIFRGGRVVGELDIDSHNLAPFTFEDVEFLERTAKRLADFVEPNGPGADHPEHRAKR